MDNKIIDVHVHFGAPGDRKSGYYMSKKFKRTPAYYAMLIITKSLFKKITYQTVKEHMFKVINGSKYVDKFVFLAMDEVYDDNGDVQVDKTNLFTSNKCIVDLAKENDRILFGASVHPYRSDWNAELDYCVKNGAVLCKWIPSSQLINPEDPKCIPFYEKLAEINLPLLCHAGPEYAIPTSDKKYDEYNNPIYLRNALEKGVTVIIAHCAMPYFWKFDKDYKNDWEDFLKLFKEAEKKDWKLYADLSAICTLLRIPYTEKVVNNIPSEKLLYGSDYPIPLSEFSYSKIKNFFLWIKFLRKVFKTENTLDKNYLLIKNMGFKDKIFFNAHNILKLT